MRIGRRVHQTNRADVLIGCQLRCTTPGPRGRAIPVALPRVLRGGDQCVGGGVIGAGSRGRQIPGLHVPRCGRRQRPAGGLHERQAAALVRRRFQTLGYDVTVQRFRLPDGDRSLNVVARTPGRVRVIAVGHMDGVRGTRAANDNGSGTALVKDINPASASSSPYYLTNINGMLFFSADKGDGNGRQVWITKFV